MSDLSRFLKDVEEDVSDVFKSVEKAGSDYFHSDYFKYSAYIGIGALIGGPAGAVGGAYMAHSTIQQEEAIEEAEKMQERQIAAQKEMQQRQIELAGQQMTLTEKQMELQMGQRQIGMLAQIYLEEDQRGPRILTLPASREPPGIIDRINLWIDEALRA